VLQAQEWLEHCELDSPQFEASLDYLCWLLIGDTEENT
jgi:hypothetical protein